MLPLSVKLRAISQAEDLRTGSRARIDRCEGFRVDGPDGRVGRVDAIDLDGTTGEPARLQVRTGLFVRRTVAVSVRDIDSVDTARQRVNLRIGADP
jgi:hypothetical protein